VEIIEHPYEEKIGTDCSNILPLCTRAKSVELVNEGSRKRRIKKTGKKEIDKIMELNLKYHKLDKFQ
jgi:hypothetical protein